MVGAQMIRDLLALFVLIQFILTIYVWAEIWTGLGLL
jgi:hypothetical protein